MLQFLKFFCLESNGNRCVVKHQLFLFVKNNFIRFKSSIVLLYSSGVLLLRHDPKDKRKDTYIDPKDYTRQGGDVNFGCCGMGSLSQIIIKDTDRKQRERKEKENLISNHGMVLLDL